jgi:uncharacterized phage-associated protein
MAPREEVISMLNCLDIARYFIIRSYEDGREAEMTNMKVQKLLYYAQSLHLALYNDPLFSEEIQAWRYGPVCPPAYSFYSDFEAKQLPIPDGNSLTKIPQEKQKLLEEVWEYFGEYHAYYLSGMTHLEFPWKKARKGLPSYASSTEAIKLEDMFVLGQQKLEEIERDHPLYQAIVPQLLEQAFDADTPSEIVKQGEVRDWLSSLLA